MDNDSLLDTIRRLLALGGSPNQHEARSALAKAEELMARHNLAMADVEGTSAQRGDSLADKQIWEGGRTPPCEYKFVGPLLQEFFGVRLYWKIIPLRPNGLRKKLMMFGRPSNLEIGQYVFIYLSGTFRDLWARQRRICGATRHQAQDFYLGLSVGLAQKLRDQRRGRSQQHSQQQRNALVAMDGNLDRMLAEKLPDMEAKARQPVINNMSLAAEGRRQGRAIRLRDAVTGTPDQNAAALASLTQTIRKQRSRCESQ